MTEPEVPKNSQPRGDSSVWQSLLVLPALGSLGLGVVLPLWLVAVAFSTALSLAWCEQRLNQLFVRNQDLLIMATVVSAVLMLGVLGAATWESLQESLHQGTQTEPGRPKKGWLLWHPWWTLGIGLVIADVLLWRAPNSHPLAVRSCPAQHGHPRTASPGARTCPQRTRWSRDEGGRQAAFLGLRI